MTQDMSAVIQPRSDQLNADSLLSGPRTITIREVSVSPGTEQPVSIFFNEDDGKPWKPCKSMSRLLVAAWGPDAKQYAGRSATLYCDPKVKWGGMEVGGIRVSHLSHIDTDLVLALTLTKGKKAPTRVKPLRMTTATKSEPRAVVQFSMENYTRAIEKILSESKDHDELTTRFDRMADWRKQAAQTDRDTATELRQRVETRLSELSAES